MPNYIITSKGKQISYNDYINGLRAACNKYYGNPDKAKLFRQAMDYLIAAMMYSGDSDVVAESDLSATISKPKSAEELENNVSIFRAFLVAEEKLITIVGVPEYLNKVYPYLYDYSKKNENRDLNKALEWNIDKYDDEGVKNRAKLTVKAIQEVLDLKEKDLVPENEDAARLFIARNYYALHIGENIDSLLNQMSNEFELSDNDNTESIKNALLHKQKLIQNLLIYEKKWHAQANPLIFDDSAINQLHPYEEKPDEKYDNIKLSSADLVESDKGKQLREIGKILESSGLTIAETEEIVKARLVDDRLANTPGIDGMTDEEVSKLAEQIENSLTQNEIFEAMKDYAAKVAEENSKAEERYDLNELREAYEKVNEVNEFRRTHISDFIEEYISPFLNSKNYSAENKIEAYDLTKELLKPYLKNPDAFKTYAGNIKSYERFLLGIKNVEDILEEKSISEKEADELNDMGYFAENLVKNARKQMAEQEEANRQIAEHFVLNSDLKKEGISYGRILKNVSDQINNNFNKFTFTMGRGTFGLSEYPDLMVAEAFGETPDKEKYSKATNIQSFRIELALLSCAPQKFPGGKDAFTNKIEFISNFLTDPEFRKDNQSFIASPLGGCLMSEYEKLEKRLAEDPDDPKVQNVFTAMYQEALQTANTVALYHPELAGKTALIAHAVQNIQYGYEITPDLCNLLKNAGITESEIGDQNMNRVKSMNQGLIELCEISKRGLLAKKEILNGKNAMSLKENSLGEFFAGEIVKLSLENEKAINQNFIENGKNPVSPTLLLLSTKLRNKQFSEYIGEMIEKTDIVKKIRETSFDKFQRALVHYEHESMQPDRKLPDGVDIAKSPEIAELTKKVLTEISRKFPQKLADEINHQVQDAKKGLIHSSQTGTQKNNAVARMESVGFHR